MIYLDNNATTPVDPRVLERMLPFFSEKFGNAGSAHGLGAQAANAVERARAEVAALIGASPEEIVFTSGGTEATNLAILGVAAAYRKKGAHVITQSTEHSAVLETCAALERQGGSLTVLPVDEQGRVDPGQLAASIRPETILASIMHVNNEIGTVQPIEAIADICAKRNVLFHTDAVQSLGKIELDVRTTPVQLASFSAHKLYGPKGIGALYVRRSTQRVRLLPCSFGGSQEQGLRPGTLNVPGIVGMGEACRIAAREIAAESARLLGLRDRLHRALSRELERVHLNGHPTARLPGSLHVAFDGIDARELVALCPDVAFSVGSACTSGSLEPSHVLRALGQADDRARSAIRFCLGRFSTEADVDAAATILVSAVRALRGKNPLYRPG